MEVTLGCQTASVTVFDANFVEVVSFSNIPVMGDTGLCQASDRDRSFAPVFGSKDYR
jgi:hypothetical protein